MTILDLGLGTVGHSLLGSLAGSIVLVDLGHIGGNVLTHSLERELVHILRQQQHVIAAVEHALYHGHLGQALTRVTGGVVDGLLILGHALGILGQGNHLLFLGRPEQQQVGELIGLHAIARVDAVLKTATKVLKELLVGLAIVVAHILKIGGNLLFHTLGDGLELTVLLQRLARDVERHVSGIHDAADKVVVVGQQVVALLHDQDVGAVECQTLLVILAVQIERRAARHKQQGIVLERALGMEADGARRIVKVVERGLVELVVVLLLDIGAALLPDRCHGIDGLELLVVLVLGLVIVAGVLGLGFLAALGHHHLNRVAHIVAVLLNQALETPLGQEAIVGLGLAVGIELLVLAQRQDDIGTVLGALTVLDGVALKTVGFPHMGDILAIGAADDLHMAGDHKSRVEAHAKLADDVDIRTLLLGVLGLKLLGAGMGDGAQIALELLGGHANAVIRDGNGAGVFIKGNANSQVALVDLDARILQALKVELVDGVARVRDKLAQEDFLIGVDGVDHEVEQFFALGLKLTHVQSFRATPVRKNGPVARAESQTCYVQT